MDVGEQLGAIHLETADGKPTDLSHHLDRILVVQLLRYYG